MGKKAKRVIAKVDAEALSSIGQAALRAIAATKTVGSDIAVQMAVDAYEAGRLAGIAAMQGKVGEVAVAAIHGIRTDERPEMPFAAEIWDAVREILDDRAPAWFTDVRLALDALLPDDDWRPWRLTGTEHMIRPGAKYSVGLRRVGLQRAGGPFTARALTIRGKDAAFGEATHTDPVEALRAAIAAHPCPEMWSDTPC